MRFQRPRRNQVATTALPVSQLSSLTLSAPASPILSAQTTHGKSIQLPAEILLNIISQQLDDPNIWFYQATPRNIQALSDFIDARLVQSHDILLIKRNWLCQRIDSLVKRIWEYPVHEDLKMVREEAALLFEGVRNVATEERDAAALEWTALMCEWCIRLMATMTSVMENFKHSYGPGIGDLWEAVRIFARYAKPGERYLAEGEELEINGALKDLNARLPEDARRWEPKPAEEHVW